MAKLVEQLYFDKINVGNRCCIESQRTINVLNRVNDLEDKIMKKYSDDKELLCKFVEAFAELASITAKESYAVGFRKGSKFTYEALNIDEPKE